MINKPLLAGLAGFLLGGLLVAVAATTFDKPNDANATTGNTMSTMTMDDMTASLDGKSGDDYDKAFIAAMIEHHEGAVEMAKLSAENAKHEEIKKLSSDIIAAQEKEIEQMRQWQQDWDYHSSESMDGMHDGMAN